MDDGRHPDLTDPASVTVRPALPGDALAWDRFVEAHPDGTFFHRWGWSEVFVRAFGFRPYYLVAECNGRICGLLPLVLQRHFLFGTSLVAAPFLVEGGPLAHDDRALSALDRAAVAIMEATRAPALEFRSRRATRAGWVPKRGLYATFAGPIGAGEEALLARIPRKERAVVRKALGGGLAATVDAGIDRFFALYALTMRNHGTPIFPKRYFSLLRAVFGADCEIMVIEADGVPQSTALSFYFRDTVLPYYNGSSELARRTGANDLLYFEIMRLASARGYRRFDFGRSKAGTGAFAFKKNWGFEPEWLEYEFYLPPGAALPEKNPNNPRYARLIALWKRLPVPLANLIGPYIVGGLG